MKDWQIVGSSLGYAASYNRAVDAVARERLYLATVEGFPLEGSQGYIAFMEGQNLPQYFALCEGVVVGWCDITPRSVPEFAHVGVLGMGVLAEYRGRGMGRALLKKALVHAQQVTHLERVELVVYRSNAGAIALYETMGFVFEGEKLRARKIDGRYDNEVLMAKFL